MSSSRLPLIDAMKGVGCLVIILHHLAIYGPMSEIVSQAAPQLIESLELYARLAVQIFFVLAGFLVAGQLTSRSPAISRSAPALIWKRYKRLITPFLFSLTSAILITAIVRPWFDHESLSPAPNLFQLLTHALLLHDVLGIEALSAGVWFVAIDFQLFASTILLTLLMRRATPHWEAVFPLLIIVLSAVSLWFVNRNSQYDSYAPYFFGAYGLGMLAFWSTRPSFGALTLLVIATLGSVALYIEFRNPISVALATAVLVSIAAQKGWLNRWPRPGILTWLGTRSYSIFLIHYGICIGINALWSILFPTGVFINALGMLTAVLVSVGAGALLYRYIESQSGVIGKNWTTALLIVAVTTTLVLESMTW